jgi:hypothetical protein
MSATVKGAMLIYNLKEKQADGCYVIREI